MDNRITRGTAAGFAALFGHAALVATAVYATAAGTPPVDTRWRAGPEIYFPTTTPERSARERSTDVPVSLVLPEPSSLSVEAPTGITAGLPPLDRMPQFDVGGFLARSPDGGPGGTSGPFGAGPYPMAAVERAPEPLAGPPLEYPTLLRQAGIEGRVVVEAVIDTTGRVERNTLRVVQSSHPGFEAPALEYVREALYRPGEVGGRAVRVLVRQPIDFRLRR